MKAMGVPRRRFNAWLAVVAGGLVAETGAARAALQPTYAPLPRATADRMDEQRTFVRTLVADKTPGNMLHGTSGDFGVLQRLLDLKLVPPTDAWKLEALGVVFGDALIRELPGLAWCQATDDAGPAPVLRYRQTSVHVAATTMIARRVQAREAVNVPALASACVESTKRRIAQAG